MAQLNVDKMVDNLLENPLEKNPPKNSSKEKIKELEVDELPQVAQIEEILNHQMIKQSREFFKEEIAKNMEGGRDPNTKVVEKK